MKIACNKCYKLYEDLEKRTCDCGGIIKPLRGKKTKTYWTDDRIAEGFKRFSEENGHFPSAHEVDNCPYLPASRSIQRRFGGLVVFRTKNKLGDVDLSRGEHRSNFAKNLNVISKNNERMFYEKLKKVFTDVCVHREKPMSDDYKIRYDFYVYAKPFNFGIDVFYPNGLKNLMGCVNEKQSKLLNLKSKEFLYMVCLNHDIIQSQIDGLVKNKKHQLQHNVCVLSEDFFWERLDRSLSDHKMIKMKIA